MRCTLNEVMAGRMALAGAGVLLAVWRARAGALQGWHRRLFGGLLALCAVAGIFAYYDFGRFGFIGYWDLYHYYMGSKYSDEVGYHDLYAASLVADAEGRRKFQNIRQIRDNRTQQIIPVQRVLEQRERYKGSFSPLRWAEFKKDLGWFQKHEKARYWKSILLDRGYNPTPVWDRVGSLVTNNVSLHTPYGVYILVMLDVLLLAILFAGVGWGFGPIAMGFLMLAWGANPLHMVPLKGALLRLDWLAALVLGACFFRKRWYALAGGLVAYSASVRVFPLVFLAGPTFKVGWELIRQRRLPPWAKRFFAAFAGTGLVLVGLGSLSSAHGPDLGRWQQFAEKIAVHSQVTSHQRSGLEYLIGREHGLLWIGAALLLLAAFALAVRNMEEERLLPAGLLPMFLLTSAASYYYSVAAILVLLFADVRRRWDAAGLSLLLCAYGACAAVAISEQATKGRVNSTSWSIALLALSLYVIVRFAVVPGVPAKPAARTERPGLAVAGSRSDEPV